jgi:hypothetical protein
MTSDLSKSLVQYLKAAEEVRKAEETCEDDSDYFLSDDYDRLKQAEEEFISSLFYKLTNYKPKEKQDGSQVSSDSEILRR